MKKKVIAFDITSGDGNLINALNSIKKFLEENKEYKVIAFVKNDVKIEDKYNNIENLSFEYAKEKIEQTDGPLQVKRKSDSTLVKAIQCVIEGRADLIISAAASGPLVTAGYLFSKPINPDFKPAFAPIGKTISGKSKIFLDVGANIDVNPETLEKYAIMGSIFSKTMGFSNNPRVSLLNIGEEETKGNQLLKETHKLLKQNSKINFIGNVEPNNVLGDNEDVIISEAIMGNTFLKSYEGAFKLIYDSIKESASKSFLTKIGLMLSKTMINDLKQKMNSEQEGGATVLGLNHLILKAHGSSKERQFYNSLVFAKEINDKEVIDKIIEEF